MITFGEFLEEFKEDINEIYESIGMSKNAQLAVVSTMRRYLKDRRFDPISLKNLFESVCFSSMIRGRVDRGNIRSRARNEGRYYLVGEKDVDMTNENIVEVEGRARRGK